MAFCRFFLCSDPTITRPTSILAETTSNISEGYHKGSTMICAVFNVQSHLETYQNLSNESHLLDFSLKPIGVVSFFSIYFFYQFSDTILSDQRTNVQGWDR